MPLARARWTGAWPTPSDISWSRLAYVALLFPISLLPPRLARRLAALIGRAQYARARGQFGPQAAHMASTLCAAPNEAQRHLRRAFELMVCEDLECWLYRRMTRANVGRYVEFRGLEHLDQALAEGKGAVLYSVHTRSIFTFFVALGLLGYQPTVTFFARTPGRDRVGRWFYGHRFALLERLGCRVQYMQPRDPGLAVKSSNAVRRNGIVIDLIDYPFSGQNVEVEFLGHQVAFPRGPAIIGQVTGAPLLDVWVSRPDAGGTLVVEIGPPQHADRDSTATMRRCAARMERKIRRDPPGWAAWLMRV